MANGTHAVLSQGTRARAGDAEAAEKKTASTQAANQNRQEKEDMSRMRVRGSSGVIPEKEMLSLSGGTIFGHPLNPLNDPALAFSASKGGTTDESGTLRGQGRPWWAD
jgi:hypothetical protein